jgi:hypothetical protein
MAQVARFEKSNAAGGRCRSAHAAAAVLLLVPLVLCGGLARRASAADPVPKGTASRAAMERAVAAIPFGQISDEARAKIAPVVERSSIYRHMPAQTIEADPDLYLFLVRHPEVVVNIWELMGISNVTMRRTGPFSIHAVDGSGTTSDVELIYGTPNLHLYYATGIYEGALFKNRVNGRCVLLLRTEYTQLRDGRVQVASHLDVFVHLDSTGAEALARTLHPLVGKAADYNFLESTIFLGRISESAETNGPGMERLAGRLQKVEPAVRQRFAELTAAVSERAAARVTAQAAAARGVVPAGVPATDGGQRR